VTRVAVLRDPFVSAGSGGFAAIQTAAASFGVELTPVGVRDADEIKRGITEFARGSNEGLIVVGPPSSIALINRKLIAALAVEHHLPAVYATLAFISFGGLVSYGVDPIRSTVAQLIMSIASSKVRNPQTCRCRHRPNTHWSSISRRPRHSVSPSRNR